jgi:hypothetical protein
MLFLFDVPVMVHHNDVMVVVVHHNDVMVVRMHDDRLRLRGERSGGDARRQQYDGQKSLVHLRPFS